MNKSLTRSTGFLSLIVLSLASVAVGGWLVTSRLTTMASGLLDGTATTVDVYVGQSLAVLGSTLLGAGVLGILLAFALLAVRTLVPSAAPAVVQDARPTVHDTAHPVVDDIADAESLDDATAEAEPDATAEAEPALTGTPARG